MSKHKQNRKPEKGFKKRKKFFFSPWIGKNRKKQKIPEINLLGNKSDNDKRNGMAHIFFHIIHYTSILYKF